MRNGWGDEGWGPPAWVTLVIMALLLTAALLWLYGGYADAVERAHGAQTYCTRLGPRHRDNLPVWTGDDWRDQDARWYRVEVQDDRP